MNCLQANKLSINAFLASMGLEGKSNGKNYTWYNAPYRKDEKPSFCVFADTNKWHDHGTGENGDLITLVQKIYSCSISQALQILANNSPIQPADSFFLNKQKDSFKPTAGSQFENVKISAVNNRFLIDYLNKRGITREVWEKQKNLFQMEYTTVNKAGKTINPINLAWKTDSDSYELRGTTNFKISYGVKNITTIPGSENGLNIFEGFFSYMSALVFYETTRLKYKTIVLNSLSNKKKALPAMENAEIVNLFLDNDKDGIRDANNLQSKLGNCINRSLEIHPEHRDFNDFITEKPNN